MVVKLLSGICCDMTKGERALARSRGFQLSEFDLAGEGPLFIKPFEVNFHLLMGPNTRVKVSDMHTSFKVGKCPASLFHSAVCFSSL